MYTSPENYKEIRRLIAPLYSGESVFGCLAAHDPANRHLEREFADFCMIQKYMNYAIANSMEYHFVDQGIPWYLAQLLQGRHPDGQVLDYNLHRYEHCTDEPYLLWNFREAARQGSSGKVRKKTAEKPDGKAEGKSVEKSAARLLPNIAYALQTNMVFLYEENLIAIDFQPEEHVSEPFKRSLDNLMMQNGLCGGRSMVFSDITELETALQQTRIALSAANSGEIVDYIDEYPNYVLRAVTSQKDGGGLTWPGLERLLQKDPEYGRDLLVCLKNYILSGRNMSVTAKALYIHRHTVLYRIQKIESFLKIKIDALEEKELVLLYLACCILLGNS
ncbi:MAG: helix-turn-helix domain-containing protein [Lachnospiraceae bacterium]|nr:helix-turn-helix domain-containing protein [Lachnospiraceae bacterium]